jgi:phosphoglycolate phosphatase-like HAD superfamily hydrolase
MPIILWDIDGTLLRSRGKRVSTQAFVRALQLACQLDGELVYPTDVGGKTDAQIALEVMLAAALSEDRAVPLLPDFSAAYCRELELNRALLLEDLRVLPGAREALERLHHGGIPQSVLTGNLETVARLKLACLELDQYLDLDGGAYGSDHRDRTELVPIARQRMQQRLGQRIAPEDVVIVGDTPRDIACARAGGARVVAIATGSYSREALEACTPDAVLDSLEPVDAVLEAVLATTARVQ